MNSHGADEEEYDDVESRRIPFLRLGLFLLWGSPIDSGFRVRAKWFRYQGFPKGQLSDGGGRALATDVVLVKKRNGSQNFGRSDSRISFEGSAV